MKQETFGEAYCQSLMFCLLGARYANAFIVLLAIYLSFVLIMSKFYAMFFPVGN